MKPEEIITKAIEKSVENGWDVVKEKVDHIKEELPSFEKILGREYTEKDAIGILAKYGNVSEIIFDHEFAKAFWGEEEVVYFQVMGISRRWKSWEYHIMQLVLSEDRIKYISKFL